MRRESTRVNKQRLVSDTSELAPRSEALVLIIAVNSAPDNATAETGAMGAGVILARPPVSKVLGNPPDFVHDDIAAAGLGAQSVPWGPAGSFEPAQPTGWLR